MMLMECVTVLDRVDGNHLVPPAINIFQPKQQAMAHLMKILLYRNVNTQLLLMYQQNPKPGIQSYDND